MKETVIGKEGVAESLINKPHFSNSLSNTSKCYPSTSMLAISYDQKEEKKPQSPTLTELTKITTLKKEIIEDQIEEKEEVFTKSTAALQGRLEKKSDKGLFKRWLLKHVVLQNMQLRYFNLDRMTAEKNNNLEPEGFIDFSLY